VGSGTVCYDSRDVRAPRRHTGHVRGDVSLCNNGCPKSPGPTTLTTPTVKMKFTLSVSVPNGGRNNRGVTTVSVPLSIPTAHEASLRGHRRPRFVHVADRGRPDRFTTGTCRLRRGSSWSASARPGIPAASLTPADSGTSEVRCHTRIQGRMRPDPAARTSAGSAARSGLSSPETESRGLKQGTGRIKTRDLDSQPPRIRTSARLVTANMQRRAVMRRDP